MHFDPDQLSEWFGPVGYSVPRETVDMDVRVGGHERFTMVADDPAYPPGGPVNATFDEYLATRPNPARHEFLRHRFAQL